MEIHNAGKIVSVTTNTEIKSVLLGRQTEDPREVWLSHGKQKYPTVNIVLMGERACLHYFPRERHPGFQSIGNRRDLVLGATTVFLVPGNSIEIPNESIVTITSCLAVAEEFLLSTELPKAIGWKEL